MYIWQRDDWTLFRWDVSRVNARLLSLRYAQGKLAGRLSALGFGVNSTAMLRSSVICDGRNTISAG